jgi:DNA-directed RNA polymerase subunit RPC12/RpoP
MSFMIECRHCRAAFRQTAEKIGARCPTCRRPLFEKERPRAPVVDLGPCAAHQDNSAVAKCQLCGKMMCALCRTRWDEEIVCAECLDQSLGKGEASPRLARMQDRQAASSLTLAILGWGVLLLSLLPLNALFRGNPGESLAIFALLLFFGSLMFALLALGQAAACIRNRGRRLVMATSGLTLAGLHVGLCLGILVLNIWHH